MSRMRAILVVASMVLGGCSNGGATDADCQQQVRLDGVVYAGWSVTEEDAQRFGEAEVADCDDTSEDAKGSYFAGEPEHVTVWSFDGYPPNRVLGVRFDKQSYTMFIDESLSGRDRDRIIRQLRTP